MVICNKQHRLIESLALVPTDSSGMSQNKCPGCAYESGYRSGLQMDVSLNLPFQNLPNCQHATTQSKDIFAAFAQGYFDGVNDFHQQKTA